MKRLTLFIIIISGLALSSCKKDFLNRVPLDQIVDETFWTTENQLVLAANGLYANIKNKNTVDMDQIGDNTYNSSTTDYRNIAAGRYGIDVNTINNEWGSMYSAIRECNVFLANYNRATTVSEARREELAAEARVIRAYTYAYLTLFYGDVPLITTPITIEEAYGPRDPAEKIQDFILNELQEASEHLKAELPAADKSDLGRIRKGAALGLKARYALYFGRYDVAEKAAKDVMDLGVYQLYNTGNPDNTYNNFFTWAGKMKNGNNKETIIARLNLINESVHNLSREIQVPDQSSRFNPTKSLVDAYLCSDGLPIDKSPLYKETSYNDVFQNRDPRMKQTVLAPGAQWGGRYDGKPGNTDPDIFTTPKFLSDRRGCVTVTGYYFTKYVELSAVGKVGQDENDIHVLRYGEILLTYAEARFEQGKLTQDDLDKTINLLRGRVGMHPMILTELAANDMDLRTEIRRERRVELVLEGQRYFDIKRWKQGSLLAEPIKGMKKSWAMVQADVSNLRADSQGYIIVDDDRSFTDPKNYLWPVPMIQRDRNPNLGQNPGWE